MTVAVIISMAVSVSMAIAMLVAVIIATPVAVVIAVRIAMVFVLAIVIAVIVAVLGAIVAGVELLLPALMPAPVGALVMTGEGSTIAIARIKPAIVISTEAYRANEPRARTNKNARLKPLRPIVTERRTLVRRVIEVPIRTDRGVADINVDTDLRVCLLR